MWLINQDKLWALQSLLQASRLGFSVLAGSSVWTPKPGVLQTCVSELERLVAYNKCICGDNYITSSPGCNTPTAPRALPDHKPYLTQTLPNPYSVAASRGLQLACPKIPAVSLGAQHAELQCRV